MNCSRAYLTPAQCLQYTASSKLLQNSLNRTLKPESCTLQADAVGALLLGAQAWTEAGAPTQAHAHALAARLHAQQLHLDPLAAAASVALANIWLAISAWHCARLWEVPRPGGFHITGIGWIVHNLGRSG